MDNNKLLEELINELENVMNIPPPPPPLPPPPTPLSSSILLPLLKPKSQSDSLLSLSPQSLSPPPSPPESPRPPPPPPPPPLRSFKHGFIGNKIYNKTFSPTIISSVVNVTPIMPPITTISFDPCICNRCGNIYNNDSEYLKHECKKNVNKSNTFIPTVSTGKYNCPLCDNKYSSQYILGEHFLRDHNDYEQINLLDDKKSEGFPGFKLLKHIGMVKKYYIKENNEICDTICDICKEDLVNPYKFLCCNNIICKICLKKYITITNNVKCPYCKTDHTYTKSEYITFIEPSDVTDRSKWIPWWINHLDNFL